MCKLITVSAAAISCRLFSLAFAVLLLGFSVSTWAQEVTATMNGVVTDPSGAAISGAKVTATDLDRGTVYPATTDSGGLYNLTRLPVGRYEVRVENPGFQTAVQSNIVLVLNQIAKVDFQMQVGNVNQTVEVTGAAPVLQTETTQLGTVLDARTNVALPLATRNYNQLTLLAPGAVATSPIAFTGAQSTFNSGRPYINGNREQVNDYLLDGMDNNQISENDVGYAPSVDAIQEFNLITQNASAEFGNYMGGIISVSIKSGTNSLHGDAFEFLRNNVLNANEWQNNLVGTPTPLLRWNEFGGTIGGPIKKDKLFIFGDYQGSRYDEPGTSSGFTVFTAAERAGNFGAYCTAGFNAAGICANPAQQIYNPYSSTNPSTRAAYPFNVITTGISPIAKAILSSPLYPAPINGNSINNQVNTTHSYTNGDQGDVKVDWIASDKDHVWGRYSQQHVINPVTNSQPLLYDSLNTFPLYNGVFDYTRTFTPTFVNDFRGGVNYYPAVTGNSNSIGNSNFGIPGAPSSFLPEMLFTQGNLANSSFGNADITQDFSSTVGQLEDTAIISKGSHTFHAGFQIFRDRIDAFYSGNEGEAGIFTFNGQYTANPAIKNAIGIPEADFLLGLPQQVGSGTVCCTWGQRSWIYAAFIQDDWKVTSKLTLNLGLRWELHTPWDEVDNRQTNFTEFSGQVLLSGHTSLFNDNNALYNQYNGLTNFQPRVGLAWQVTNNTVVRASYSLSNFLEGTGTNLRLTRNPPWTVGHLVTYSSAADLVLPPTTLDQGFAPFLTSGCTTATVLTYSASCFAGATIFTWDPNNRPAVSNQWNFSVQRQFGNSMTLQLAYVGQNNDHLMVPINASQLFLAPNGTVSPVSPYLAGNPTLAALGPTDKLTDTNGIQNYNALQVSLQKRLSSGLEFQANYTWSKCLTNSIGYYGLYGDTVASANADQSGGNVFYWQNTYNAHGNYGPCYYDVEHAFNGFVTYDIPFGRGRTFGSNMNPAVNAFVGDWQINGIVTVHSGFPFPVTASDNSGTGSFGALASCSGSPIVYGEKNSPSGGYQFWDPSTFYQPASGFGNCGVGIIRGPGLHTADLSVSKLFAFTERQNLEFRAEAINFTNTPILGGPINSFGTTLGLINTSQGARNIQFGLKYNF